MQDIYFEVTCKLGKHIRITKKYWEHLVTFKHPSMRGKEDDIRKTLADPDQIRRDPQNKAVFQYHKKCTDHYVRVVVKHLDDEGFIITTFPEKKTGGGELVWQK